MFSTRGGFFKQQIINTGSFVASFNNTGAPGGIVTTSTGSEIYAVGIGTGATSNISILKLDNNGNLTWQKEINGNADFGTAAAIDDSGNIFVAGYTNNSGAGLNDGYIAKVTSTGNISWQRTLGTSATDSAISIAVASGANANVFLGIRNNNQSYVANYSTSGTLNGYKKLDINMIQPTAMTYDTNSNVFVVGSTASNAITARLAASGFGNGTSTFNDNSTGGTGLGYTSVARDSTGNFYIGGIANASPIGIISKNYANGVIITCKSISNTYSINGIGTDGSNIYALGETTTNDIWYAKLYSNLAIQWQRTLSTANSCTPYGITYANNYVIIYGRSDYTGTYQQIVAKLPADGSGQGVHGDYTISNSSFTTSTFSTSYSSGNIATSTSLTGGTPTLAIANSSFTQTLTTF